MSAPTLVLWLALDSFFSITAFQSYIPETIPFPSGPSLLSAKKLTGKGLG